VPSRSPEPTRAIYVRLPVPEAEKLDRAAERLRASKRDVIAALLSDHLEPDDDGLVQRLQRSVIDTSEPMTLGRHSFTPAPAAEVLTLDDAAELLRVSPQALRERAESGDIPARRIGDEWRFSREALLAWLGMASAA
jgi:excisionase family DNA binding protein